MQMMISKLSRRMFLTNVSEHFQEKFTYKVTQIANISSFQQETSLCLFGRIKFKEEL